MVVERKFVAEKLKSFKIRELIESKINRYAGIGDVIVEKTPLGEKITIYANRPGLVIGAGGELIRSLTEDLKNSFELENPQVDLKEITNENCWAAVVAKKIASSFERFGAGRYKAIGYRSLTEIMKAGARGAEIRLSGRGLPGERARSWRFYAGYIKKSGDTARTIIDVAYDVANLRSGSVGIKIRIMPAGARLPDDVILREVKFEEVEISKKHEKDLEEVRSIVEAEPKKQHAVPKKKAMAAKEKKATKRAKESKVTPAAKKIKKRGSK